MSEVRTNWNRGQPIPARDMRTNSEALAGLVKSPELAGQNVPRNDARYSVQITARSSEGVFEFAQVRYNPTTGKIALVPGGVTHATLGLITSQGGQPDGGAGMIYVGDIVTIRPGAYIDAQKRTQWEFTPDSKMTPATVTQDGGDAGDDENPCTLTYTVKAQDGETRLTGASPENQRRSEGEYAVATHGHMYYKLVSGVPTLTLGWVNEEYIGGSTAADNEGYNASTGSASTEVDGTKTPGGSDAQSDDGNFNFEGVSDTAQGQPQTTHIPVLTRVNKDGATTDVWQWINTADLPVQYDDGGNGGGYRIIDLLIKVADGAATGVSVIDSADFSGRMFGFAITRFSGSVATYKDTTGTATSNAWHKIGETETTDYTVYNTGEGAFFIDVSDSHQLKFNLTSSPSGDNRWYHVIIRVGDRKLDADPDIDIT